MELKTYQKKVIADLSRFLELLNQSGNTYKAYCTFWEEKNVPVGRGVPPYQNILPQTPHLCLKVPTGGGKTFLACNSIKPIFDALPPMKVKSVAWLVPSDAILEQTVKALQDTDHPYRQKIDVDFAGRVEVYTKQQLLYGQNFNPTTVSKQLSIFVLSYDSFRSNKKEGRKAYQENSNLLSFLKAYGTPDKVIEGADETALIQIINLLSPLVIVDESHHARSELSLEMLNNFNPCFVLDLTATPKKNSNILSYVDAVQLKREHMVKLPVIVYNRDSQTEVLADAIDLRQKLEDLAKKEQAQTGCYIRPIILFQAQPKGKEDTTTFIKLKEKIVEAGIPIDEIAIKTAEVNELKNVDLLSPTCKIRYIITINALKEGWDCPFAYILATLANKTSQVDVEQILGRILRQPHTRMHSNAALNMSYCLTSSSDFKATLDNIVRGLNSAGFSSKEYRLANQIEESSKEIIEQTTFEINIPNSESGDKEEFLDFDGGELREALVEIAQQAGTTSHVDTMLENAQSTGQAYDEEVYYAASRQGMDDIPLEVRDKMSVYHMNHRFMEEATKLRIPQFYREVPQSLFVDGDTISLTQAHLAEGFTLKGKPYTIDFESADDEVYRVDIDTSPESTPKYFKMSGNDSRDFKQFFSKLPEANRIDHCKGIIHKQLNKMDTVDATELKEYISRIVGDMNRDQLSSLEKSVMGYAEKIKAKVKTLLEEHAMAKFKLWIEQGKITCKPSYQLPESISPLRVEENIAYSLYGAEEEMNGFEKYVCSELTGLPNIKWWHRNIARHGFCINGFINHYPDFIVMTTSGKIVLIETKGDYLDNLDTRQKIELGRAWQNAAGHNYRYYMVFQYKDLRLDGAVHFDRFMEIIRGL